jgi:Skp family chaperone for outer membrane proteins
MKKLLKTAIAGLLLTAAAQPVVVMAQAAQPIVPGLGIANLEAVVANSSAFKNAQTARQTSYKAQLDQANARRNAITAQLQPLADKFNRDRAAPNANQTALQQQAQQIQQIQASGEQELQRILQPVALSEAYAEEQINDKLAPAVQAAMNSKQISLLLSPGDVISAHNTYNLNQAILDELNKLIPSVQVVPPSGWEPRQVREARAQQGAAPSPAAAPARPAGQQPQGR